MEIMWSLAQENEKYQEEETENSDNCDQSDLDDNDENNIFECFDTFSNPLQIWLYSLLSETLIYSKLQDGGLTIKQAENIALIDEKWW